MTIKELRELLESMPCPFCTKSVSEKDLKDILICLDEEMKEWGNWYEDGVISKDKYNLHWWETLEKLANQFEIPYYEDLEEQ